MVSNEAKVTTLEVLTWVDVCTYSCVFLFGFRNTAKYLVKQGKWRTFYLSMFYLCTFVVAASRIIYFVSYYFFHKESKEEEN